MRMTERIRSVRWADGARSVLRRTDQLRAKVALRAPARHHLLQLPLDSLSQSTYLRGHITPFRDQLGIYRSVLQHGGWSFPCGV